MLNLGLTQIMLKCKDLSAKGSLKVLQMAIKANPNIIG
jgi:hypothetical protein